MKFREWNFNEIWNFVNLQCFVSQSEVWSLFKDGTWQIISEKSKIKKRELKALYNFMFMMKNAQTYYFHFLY